MEPPYWEMGILFQSATNCRKFLNINGFSMTKSEFIHKLMARKHMARNEAEKILNAFLDSVEDALFRDRHMELRGFGSFNVRRRKERNSVNPKTGEKIVVPACNAIVFRPSPALTDFLN